MTIPNQENAAVEQKPDNSVDANLSKQRNYYQKQLEQERIARQQAEERATAAEKAAQERSKMSPLNEDDDDDNEPYVDKKKLNKTLNKFGNEYKQQTRQEIQVAVHEALQEERKTNYLKENNDFNQIMNPDTIQKFADKYPRLAENILRMPDGFERQKLVYENIKALGVDKPEQKQPSIQDKIDSNRKGPFYQPSNISTGPYSQSADFSDNGQKAAYVKMKALQKQLRI